MESLLWITFYQFFVKSIIVVPNDLDQFCWYNISKFVNYEIPDDMRNCFGDIDVIKNGSSVCKELEI